jgi:AraC-like DNA-binding protein
MLTTVGCKTDMSIEDRDLYRDLLDWLAQAWAGQGLSLEAATGCSAEAFPHWRQSRQRVPVLEFVRVLNAASGHRDDGCFSLDARRVSPGSHSLMVEALLGCAHLGAASHMAARFYDVVLESLDCHFLDDGECFVIVFAPRQTMVSHPSLLDYLLFSLHRTLSWIVGLLLPVQRLEGAAALALPGPGLASLIRCEQRLDTGRVAIAFSRRYFNLPLVRTAGDWRTHVADVRAGILHWPTDDGSVSASVRAALRTSLDRGHLGHSLGSMAAELGFSPATLRRRLQEEGASYQRLLDDFRRSVAIDCLYSKQQKVADVAAMLGYAEPRSFTRAFKAWTGYPPSAYEHVTD